MQYHINLKYRIDLKPWGVLVDLESGSLFPWFIWKHNFPASYMGLSSRQCALREPARILCKFYYPVADKGA